MLLVSASKILFHDYASATHKLHFVTRVPLLKSNNNDPRLRDEVFIYLIEVSGLGARCFDYGVFV